MPRRCIDPSDSIAEAAETALRRRKKNLLAVHLRESLSAHAFALSEGMRGEAAYLPSAYSQQI